jgi:hypothetical protein
MTHPRLESPLPALADHELSLGSLPRPDADASPTVAWPTTVYDRAAANDDAAATLPVRRNPLWIIVIGMACLFGVMAVVMALG